MDGFQEYKKALGLRANEMSEEQIRHLMDLHDRLAGAIFDLWVSEIKQHDPPTEMAD